MDGQRIVHLGSPAIAPRAVMLGHTELLNRNLCPASRIVPGPADLRQSAAHNLVAWRPQGVMDDQSAGRDWRMAL